MALVCRPNLALAMAHCSTLLIARVRGVVVLGARMNRLHVHKVGAWWGRGASAPATVSHDSRQGCMQQGIRDDGRRAARRHEGRDRDE